MKIWHAGDTWYVGNVTLDDGVTLNIEPGAVVKFGLFASLDASSGTLLAKGKPHDYIVFTSCNDDTVGDVIEGSNGTPCVENWNGSRNRRRK